MWREASQKRTATVNIKNATNKNENACEYILCL
jgi:hypothetical protein